MQARDLMTRSVVTVDEQTTVREAAALLAVHGIASMPVVDAGGRVVGMFSEADAIRGRLPHDPRSHMKVVEDSGADPSPLVGDVMSGDIVCVGPSLDIADLAQVMLERKLRAVPVVDSDHLCGIVSRRDLVRSLLRPDAQIVLDIRCRLQDAFGSDPVPRISVDQGVVTIHAAEPRWRWHADAVETIIRSVPGVIRIHHARV